MGEIKSIDKEDVTAINIREIPVEENKPTINEVLRDLEELKPQSANKAIDLSFDDEAPVAIKFDSGKPSLAIIPPRAYEKVGKAFHYGSQKYSADNYMNGGFTHRRLLSAALRHINAHLKNEDIDPESGNCHLSHAVASIMMLMELIACDKDKDDRYKP